MSRRYRRNRWYRGHAFTTGVVPHTSIEHVLPNTWVEYGIKDGLGCDVHAYAYHHFTAVELSQTAAGPALGLEHATCFRLGDRGLAGDQLLRPCRDRLHPAREELPQLWGSRPAFAQMLWRHLLFGALLGELERRLNPPEDAEELTPMVVSTNGHGRVEDLAGVAAGDEVSLAHTYPARRTLGARRSSSVGRAALL